MLPANSGWKRSASHHAVASRASDDSRAASALETLVPGCEAAYVTVHAFDCSSAEFNGPVEQEVIGWQARDGFSDFEVIGLVPA